MREAEHLPARHLHPHRPLKLERRHHRQEKLILRTQRRPERAADERRDDPHLAAREAEDVGDVELAVVRSLRLVVDRQAAVRLVDHRRGVHLHRIVMLERLEIFGFVPDLGARERPLGVASRLRRGFHERSRLGLIGRVELRGQRGLVLPTPPRNRLSSSSWRGTPGSRRAPDILQPRQGRQSSSPGREPWVARVSEDPILRKTHGGLGVGMRWRASTRSASIRAARTPSSLSSPSSTTPTW